MHKEFERVEIERRVFNVLVYFSHNGYKEEHDVMLHDYNVIKDDYRQGLDVFVTRYEGLAKKLEERKLGKKESEEPGTR